MKDITIRFSSVDGFYLEGSLRRPEREIKSSVLLVHGITVDREEDGFYSEFASRLATADIASFRFDLRCHGKSEGKFEELTLTGVLNDIGSAAKELRNQIPITIPMGIIAASFGGGLSAYWASQHRDSISTLVLLNPVFDYGARMLFSKPYWENDHLTKQGATTLRKKGWLPHGSFRMGRALVNELLYIKPYDIMSRLEIPVLTIHGDKDSMVPFDIAKKYALANSQSQFIPIKGADHGFTKPGDDEFTAPETIEFRSFVFNKVLGWIREHGS